MPQSVAQRPEIVITENLVCDVLDAVQRTKIKKPLVARWVFDGGSKPYCKWVSE